MTCLQLWFVLVPPLRQALLKASLDKNTNVEYSSVSLCITTRKKTDYSSWPSEIPENCRCDTVLT